MLLIEKHGHNPDVLTCIANLSNDEVFTQPHLANEILDQVEKRWAETHDGENLWRNPEIKFLDPFTKSGVFLREITRRLSEGLVDIIPNLQERVDHILTRQVFGIAITNLTALLSRRSVYCSKKADGIYSICQSFETDTGNIWYGSIRHSWIDSPHRVDGDCPNQSSQLLKTGRRCRFCGANQSDYERGQDRESYAYAFIHTDDPGLLIDEIFGNDMHFDIVVGKRWIKPVISSNGVRDCVLAARNSEITRGTAII